MKDSKIINNKITENLTDIRESKFKKGLALVGAAIVTGATCVGAFAIHSLVAELTIPTLFFGSLFPIAAIGYAKCKNARIKSDRTQIKHLRRIYNNGVEQNEALNKKKSAHISNLEEKLYDQYDKIVADSILIGAGAAVWLIGSITSLATAPMALVTIGGVATFTAAMKKMVDDEKKYYEYDSNIENHKNDLVLGPIYRPERVTGNSNAVGMNKPMDKSKQYSNPTYSKAVDDYVERYAKSSTTNNRPVQKTKR